MPASFSVASMLLSSVVSMYGGVLGNRTDAAVVALSRSVASSIEKVNTFGDHGALKILRSAQLDALTSLAGFYQDGKGVNTAGDVFDRDAFLPRFQKFISQSKAELVDFRLNSQSASALNESVDATLANPSTESSRARLKALAVEAELQVWKEIGPLDPPDVFQELFHGRVENVPSWFHVYGVFIGQSLKKNDQFKSIFIADHLARIVGEAVDLRQEIDRFIVVSDQECADVRSSLARIEDKMDAKTDRILDAIASLAQRMSAQDRAEFDAQIHDLKSKYDASTALIRSLLDVLGRADVPDDQLLLQFKFQIDAIVPILKEARRSSAIVEVATARTAITQALDDGDLDAADRAYATAAAALKNSQKAIALDRCEILCEQAKIKIAKLNRVEAADLYAEAANNAEPFDHALALEVRNTEAQTCLDHANLFPDLRAMRRAVIIWRELLDTHQATDYRAAIQINLATALKGLGQRVGGTEGAKLLVEAAGAFRTAGALFQGCGMHAQWALAQNNLGNVLQALGRSRADQIGTGLLNEALGAFRAALTVFTRGEMPIEWAMANGNLGNALTIIADRVGGEAGVRLITEAIAAHRANLDVRTEAGAPADWAATQTSLASALQTLGERTDGPAGAQLLIEASNAQRASLRVYSRITTPVRWAMTQDSLGNTLTLLGKVVGGAASAENFREAVSSYEAALTVLSRAETPVDWAGTLSNLSNALTSLGSSINGEAGNDYLARAASACEDATTVFTYSSMPAQWAMLQINLANALSTLGTRRGGEIGAQLLAESIRAYEAALTVYSQAYSPVEWALAQNNLRIARDALNREAGAVYGAGDHHHSDSA